MEISSIYSGDSAEPYEKRNSIRHRQTQMGGILQQGYALVGQVEENHRRAQDTGRTQHLDIDNVADAHQQENQYLAADALKAYLAGQALIGNGAHDPGDVVNDHKGKDLIIRHSNTDG